jgi:hypothetical protein
MFAILLNASTMQSMNRQCINQGIISQNNIVNQELEKADLEDYIIETEDLLNINPLRLLNKNIKNQ